MPVTAQLGRDLLRALEAGEVRRIGENETRRIDVRFVAATNLDIQTAVDSNIQRSSKVSYANWRMWLYSWAAVTWSGGRKLPP